jgi:FMN phosphatase YigB (HAD superfamily)
MTRARTRFNPHAPSPNANSDGSVRRLFELLGLDDCFGSFTDSHLCGCEKPNPRIFECAMASLGAKPQQSL